MSIKVKNLIIASAAGVATEIALKDSVKNPYVRKGIAFLVSYMVSNSLGGTI